jgi:hypothetical protein
MSIADQLTCAKRELAMRRNAYPKWIASGRMKPATADHEIAAMEAIVATLQKLQDLEDISREMQDEMPL